MTWPIVLWFINIIALVLLFLIWDRYRTLRRAKEEARR